MLYTNKAYQQNKQTNKRTKKKKKKGKKEKKERKKKHIMTYLLESIVDTCTYIKNISTLIRIICISLCCN